MRMGIPPFKRSRVTAADEMHAAMSPSLVMPGQAPTYDLLEHERRLARIAAEEKTGYVPKGEHVYLDIQVAGAAVTSSADNPNPNMRPTIALSDETYQIPLLDKCSDWTMIVLRFRVPTSYIPLFTYVPGSCVVSIVVPPTAPGAGRYPATVAPVFATDPLNPNAIYFVEQFLSAVNVAISTAYVNARTAGFPGSPGMQPYISYNSSTGLMSINYEQTWWSPDADNGVNAGNTAALWFNFPLYETFFDSFPGVESLNPANNLDVQVLLQQSAAPPLVSGPQIVCAAGGLTSVGTLCTWNNPPVQHGLSPNFPAFIGLNQFVVISGCTQLAYNGVFAVNTVINAYSFTYIAAAIPAASPATGAPTMVGLPRGSQIPGQYNQITQETPCISSWDQFVGLRLVSDAIPVRPEWLPPVGGTQVGGRQVVTDFEVLVGDQLDTRQYLQFVSQGEFRRCDLISAEPLRRVDIKAVWVDRLGRENTIYIPDGETMTIKILFERVH